MIQNIRDEEGEIQSVLFCGDARCTGKEHFTENAEYTAGEHARRNNKSRFVHLNAILEKFKALNFCFSGRVRYRRFRRQGGAF